MFNQAVELIKRSFELYKKNLEVFFSYALLVVAPSFVLKSAAVIIVSIFDLQTEVFIDRMYGIIFILMNLIGLIISLWFSTAFIKVVAERIDGASYGNFKEELHFVKNKLMAVVTTSLLATLCIFGGSLLFIVPGIIFSVWFAFYMYAVILDNQKNGDALKFSKNLVDGRWWNVLWLLFAPTLIFTLITILIQIPLDTVSKGSPILPVKLTMFAISTVVTAFLSPFLISAQTLLYKELKSTKKHA